MEHLKTFSYYVQIRNLFSFICVSGVLHAIILTLFILNTKNLPAGHVDKSMFVYIVSTFATNHNRSKTELPATEKRSSVQPALSNPIQNISPVKETKILSTVNSEPALNPIQVSSRDNYKNTSFPAPTLQTEHSHESSMSANSAIALSYHETSFENIKELRETILAKIKKDRVYPVAARKLGIEGDITLSFLISSDGNVHNIYANGKNTALSILEKASIKLIQDSAPYYVRRDNVRREDVSIQIVISYKLDDVKWE